MKQLTEEERARGVITSSAGNHAQGVALSGQKLGCKAIIAMPVTTPAIKVEGCSSFGRRRLELVGENYDATQAYAKKRSEEEGLTYIPPFDDPYVIAGQGTVGVEVLRQLPTAEIVFVPIGGGGLAAGMAAYIKAIRPEVKVIGVEPAGRTRWPYLCLEVRSSNCPRWTVSRTVSRSANRVATALKLFKT